MTREEHYRAALERLASGSLRYSEHETYPDVVKSTARQALAAGGALPAEDTEVAPGEPGWVNPMQAIYEAQDAALALPAEDTDALVRAARRWCSPGTASEHEAALEDIRSLIPDDHAVFDAIDEKRRREDAEARLEQIAEILREIIGEQVSDGGVLDRAAFDMLRIASGEASGE